MVENQESTKGIPALSDSNVNRAIADLEHEMKLINLSKTLSLISKYLTKGDFFSISLVKEDLNLISYQKGKSYIGIYDDVGQLLERYFFEKKNFEFIRHELDKLGLLSNKKIKGNLQKNLEI